VSFRSPYKKLFKAPLRVYLDERKEKWVERKWKQKRKVEGKLI
jgi:hypothetical protein